MPLRKFSTAKITNKRVSVPITGVASGPSADRIPNFVTAAGLLGAFYDIQRTGIVKNVLAAANSAEAVTYSVDSGSLPTGLSLNTSNNGFLGMISTLESYPIILTFSGMINGLFSRYSPLNTIITVPELAAPMAAAIVCFGVAADAPSLLSFPFVATKSMFFNCNDLLVISLVDFSFEITVRIC